MKKILIVGDSFAAVWPNAIDGWVNLLAKKHNVTNIAQAGCGEYKILKQLESADIKSYDLVIVSHTSPSRVHTASHPIHKDGFHKDCDLLITDISARQEFFNSSLRTAQGWFKYHYDDQYQIDIYNLIRKRILDMLSTVPYISLTHVDISSALTIESNNIDFSDLWRKERGVTNHYTVLGNKTIYFKILDHIDEY